MRKALLSVVILLAVAAVPGYSKEISYSGKVVDANGRPVADANVMLYAVSAKAVSAQQLTIAATAQCLSDKEGKVSLKADGNDAAVGMVIARKAGYAVGAANIYPMSRMPKPGDIELLPPTKIGGVVVDEAGKPVASATVRIFAILLSASEQQSRYIMSAEPMDLFVIKTDAQGRFAFNDVPAGSKVDFLVKAPGLADLSTVTGRGLPGTYEAGDENIRLAMTVGGSIDGKVINKVGGVSLQGLNVLLMSKQMVPQFGLKPVQCDANGSFHIKDVVPGEYTITVTEKTNVKQPKVPGVVSVTAHKNPAKWVCKPGQVTVESGKVATASIELVAGKVLEVTVIDSDSNKPLADVTVNVNAHGARFPVTGVSDANGIAIIRVLPGEYYINGYKQDGSHSAQQEKLSIEESDSIVRKTIEMRGPKTAKGIVKDKAGKPVADATVMEVGMGSREEKKTDSNGSFEVQVEDYWRGTAERENYLVARDVERNLAAAVLLEDKSKQYDITLEPGLILRGKVLDPNGKPIKGTHADLTFWTGSYGMGVQGLGADANANGQYIIKALPPGRRYSVNVRAPKYGSGYSDVAASTEPVNGVIELETIMLAPANLKISGIAVDGNDTPVSDVRVNIYGKGQPNESATTGKDGRFELPACEGAAQINGNTMDMTNRWGNVRAQGGDSDVKLVLRSSSGREFPESSGGKSIKGKPMPGLGTVGLDANSFKNKAVILCFFDMNQRPSRHAVVELAKQADTLKAKGIEIAAVQASAADRAKLDEWAAGQKLNVKTGLVTGDEKKITAQWGVKGLPWMIYAGADGIVKAEGFSVEDIEKIAKN
jgi:protocatechuate 3,4-dioxygenase beta subunit